MSIYRVLEAGGDTFWELGTEIAVFAILDNLCKQFDQYCVGCVNPVFLKPLLAVLLLDARNRRTWNDVSCAGWQKHNKRLGASSVRTLNKQ